MKDAGATRSPTLVHAAGAVVCSTCEANSRCGSFDGCSVLIHLLPGLALVIIRHVFPGWTLSQGPSHWADASAPSGNSSPGHGLASHQACPLHTAPTAPSVLAASAPEAAAQATAGKAMAAAAWHVPSCWQHHACAMGTASTASTSSGTCTAAPGLEQPWIWLVVLPLVFYLSWQLMYWLVVQVRCGETGLK